VGAGLFDALFAALIAVGSRCRLRVVLGTVFDWLRIQQDIESRARP
jgi:hypothetical protein